MRLNAPSVPLSLHPFCLMLGALPLAIDPLIRTWDRFFSLPESQESFFFWGMYRSIWVNVGEMRDLSVIF